MGDGIGGPIMGILTNNAFQLLVSHVRKDNKEEYGKTEKIIIAKIDILINNELKRIEEIQLMKSELSKLCKANF